MLKKSLKYLRELLGNRIFNNSFWGLFSQASQSVLLSLFFVIIARKYSTAEFTNYAIANALYQLIFAFSTLGLSQWFIREIITIENKNELANKFFKIQLFSGLAFYIVNIVISLVLYKDEQLHKLALIIGINIIFDNLINSIKCLNISEFKQQKTFIILTVDAFLKFAVTCMLFFFHYSVISLSIALVIVRFFSLNLFLNFGSTKTITLNTLLKHKVSLIYIKKLLALNWTFIVIGSVSIINWRVSTIIISKMLTSKEVADFEISYRAFSLFQMLPIVVSSTVFPLLIQYHKNGKFKEFNIFYKKMRLYYLLYGLLCYTFIFAFIDNILPLIFGIEYSETGYYTKQMFLTIIVFPTAFLQANVLVALKLEKLDMWFNLICLLINLTLCVFGLYFLKSLSVINISIFISFTCFHILQDIALIRKGLSSIAQALQLYIIAFIVIVTFVFLSKTTNSKYVFTALWATVLLVFIVISMRRLNINRRQYIANK